MANRCSRCKRAMVLCWCLDKSHPTGLQTTPTPKARDYDQTFEWYEPGLYKILAYKKDHEE